MYDVCVICLCVVYMDGACAWYICVVCMQDVCMCVVSGVWSRYMVCMCVSVWCVYMVCVSVWCVYLCGVCPCAPWRVSVETSGWTTYEWG